MVIVLVAGYYQRFIPLMESLDLNFRLIKQKGIKLFYKVETDMTEDEVIAYVKKAIKREKSLQAYTYAVYGIYNGMLNLFPYLNDELKNKYPYYNQEYKDITQEEIESL